MVLAIVGIALTMLVSRARPVAASLVAVAAIGLGAGWLGAPLGPTRFGAPVLAGCAAASALAGVAMQAVVRAVAQARVPMARASASMIVLLELVMPVDRADDALVRTQHLASGAAATWDDAVWGELPPRGVALVGEPRVYERARAARARGALRADLAIVPAFASGAPAWKTAAGDAALVPLWRDLELTGLPGEAALSSLATSRSLAVTFDPRWGKSLARHLVPLALLDRFEPEPRGASDRRKALDASTPERARVARVVTLDPELAAATQALLGARAAGLELDGDRDVVARAQADLQALVAPRRP